MKQIPKNWIPISKTRNFALNDPLLDYLNVYNVKTIYKKPKKKIKNKNKTIKNKKINKFLDHLLNEGIQYEKNIYKKLQTRFGNNIIKICNSYEARNIINYQNTVKELNKGTKIIYQGVLYDYEKKIFGVPDLIVRTDILNDIFNNFTLSRSNQIIKAPLLNISKYHYCIIDIKNSILHFNIDEKTIRNNNNVKPFKTQLYLYNEILGKIQGYTHNEIYILGKGWQLNKQINKQNIKCYCNDPFDKPGIIDIINFDKQYKYISHDAIDWLKNLNKNGYRWKLFPPSNKYLYPNMNNTLDTTHTKIKYELSNEIGEITQIWNCSIENRNNAFNNNIYSWKNKDCNSSILGIKGKRSKIIDDMIIFQNSNDIYTYKNPIINLNNWKDNNKLTFFVDFETINSELNNETIVFMIGLGWIKNNKWFYKDYTVTQLNFYQEKQIYQEFINKIKKLTNNFTKDYNIYHWSPVEKTFYNNFNKKNRNIYPELNWCDLLVVFRDSQFFIKDCFNYSLKSIVYSLNKYKFIDTKWSNLDNGLDAMFIAYEEYKKNISVSTDNKIINNVIKYNEIDCKVLYDILLFLKQV
tara:strand:+ start:15583 stop:17322 length:1740 start_codon:yes stop_codon:yes gene_type:complete